MDRRQLLRRLAAAGLSSAGGAMGFLQRATDAELDLLENLVGRWPPFYGKFATGY